MTKDKKVVDFAARQKLVADSMAKGEIAPPEPVKEKPFVDTTYQPSPNVKAEKINVATELLDIDRYRYLIGQSDIAFFIKEFVWIEDKTNTLGISRFNLWPEQERALATFANSQFVIALKTRQIGLTWLALGYTLQRLIYIHGFMAIAISKRDDPDAIELGKRLKFMLDKLPKWMIQEKTKDITTPLTYEYRVHETIIERWKPDKVKGWVPAGEPSRFLTLPASPDTAHSFTANLILLDEWALHPFATEIWTGAYPTMNRPGFSGQVIGLSTGRKATLFNDIWDAAVAGENNFTPIFLSVWADPRRDEAWYEQTKKNLPNTYRSQYPTTPEDAFTVGEGAFFEEWNEDVHLSADHWEPPNTPAWKIIGAYDPSYNQACFKWYAVSPGVPGFPKGWLRCFREFYPKNMIDPVQAEKILMMSCYSDGQKQKIYLDRLGKEIELPGTPFHFDYIIADTSAWSPSRSTGESTADVFLKFNLVMLQADKDLENGWRRLHEWLAPILLPGFEDQGIKSARLTFTRDCGATRRTYPSCAQSSSNPNDIDKGTPHDPQDCDRYVVMSMPVAGSFKGPTILQQVEEKFGKNSPEYRVAQSIYGAGEEDTLRKGWEDL